MCGAATEVVPTCISSLSLAHRWRKTDVNEFNVRNDDQKFIGNTSYYIILKSHILILDAHFNPVRTENEFTHAENRSFTKTCRLLIAHLDTAMTSSYHNLKPAHGLADLYIPEHEPDLAKVFATCIETHDFQAAQSEREQVHLCANWAKNNYPGEVSLEDIASFFSIAKSTVAYHLSRPYDIADGCKTGKVGRPRLLDDEQVTAPLELVARRFEEKVPCTYEDIVDYFQEEFSVLLNVGSLRNFVARLGCLKTVTGVPMEDTRIFSSPSEIDHYFDRLREVIDTASIPAAFVMNVDESGFNEFVDCRQTIRVVPTNYEFNSVPVPVTRSEKRATLIAGICADGHALKPMVVLQRDTVEQELLLRGYTNDRVFLTRSEKGFVTTSLFTLWGKHVLLPEVRRRRSEHEYDGPALLLLDGFGCHQSTAFLEMCEAENIICMMFPPHTSDQLQPCDLGIFANQKRQQSHVKVDSWLNRQTRQVICIIDSFRYATTAKNVVAAFPKKWHCHFFG